LERGSLKIARPVTGLVLVIEILRPENEPIAERRRPDDDPFV